MSNFLSPTVKITEKSNNNYNINSSNNIAIFVGEFEKGPINEPIFITDILQFKLIFGRATEDNFNQWYQVFNFLQYAKNLYVCRTAGTSFKNAENNGNIANSPGPWGNIMSIEIYKPSEYHINNLNNYFNEYEIDKKFLVIIKRLGVVVESFAVNETSEIKSNYLMQINLEYGIFQLTGGFCDKASSNDYRYSYNLFSKENYEIDIIIADEDNNDLAIELAESREDCIAFLGLPRKYIDTIDVNGNILTTENDIIIYLGITEIKYLLKDPEYNLILNYLKTLKKSSYAFFVLGFALIEDGFTNKKRIINLNADVAGLKSAYSSKNSWLPSAGVQRGKIIHDDTTFLVKDEYSNILYKNGVNVFNKNILMTQKLFLNSENIINTLHARNIVNYLKRISEKLIRRYIFDLNDIKTRGHIAMQLKLLLEDVVSSGGLENAKVIVNPGETLNTIDINIIIKIPSVINRINIRLTNIGDKLMTEVIGG